MLTGSTESNSKFTSRRRFIKDLSVLACVAPFLSSCNRYFRSSKVFHIGYFSGAGFDELETAFVTELEKLGFKEGKNIIIERRFGRPNTNDGSIMGAELAKMNLDLLVVSALALAILIRNLNPLMPMVIGTGPGLVSNGFAQSMERPGGIYTGLDELPPGLTAKRLQLLKMAAPSVKNVALLSTTPGKGGHEVQTADAEKTANELGIKVKAYRAASLTELQKALQDLTNDGMNGILSFQGGLSVINRKLIINHAEKHTMPAMYQATLFAEDGGLMSWAPDLPQQFREAAHYVSKILKGAKPGDLPVKHPEKYYLTLNSSAAKKIGLTFRPEIVALATRVL